LLIVQGINIGKNGIKRRIEKINIKSIELFTIQNHILKSSMGFIGVLHPGETFILDITIII
jgi:hypothetical protein